MSIMFMNFENAQTSDPRRLLLSLSDKISLKRSVPNLTIFYTWKNIKRIYRNNQFKTSDI